MRHVFSLTSLRSVTTAVLTAAGLMLLGACSTLHESDLGANRGYNEFGTSGYKPSLASPRNKATAGAAGASKPLAKTATRKTQYSPMVERTATGVRVVQDFTTQARGKTAKANAAQVRANRAQQNAKMSKNYNNDNLLNR